MKKLKKYILTSILFMLAMLMLAFVLIAHRPARYAPVTVEDHNLISPYLTHQILPKLYNGSQLGEPFEIVVTQDGLNDVIARWPMSLQLDNFTLADPQVIFLPGRLILMATVETKTLDLFTSIEIIPSMDEQGRLTLHVNAVKLGAIDITRIALSSGKKAYMDWLASTGNNPDDTAALVCRSLLNDEPFVPVFEMYNKPLRISAIVFANGKLIINLTPVVESKTN